MAYGTIPNMHSPILYAAAGMGAFPRFGVLKTTTTGLSVAAQKAAANKARAAASRSMSPTTIAAIAGSSVFVLGVVSFLLLRKPAPKAAVSRNCRFC